MRNEVERYELFCPMAAGQPEGWVLRMHLDTGQHVDDAIGPNFENEIIGCDRALELVEKQYGIDADEVEIRQ